MAVNRNDRLEAQAGFALSLIGAAAIIIYFSWSAAPFSTALLLVGAISLCIGGALIYSSRMKAQKHLQELEADAKRQEAQARVAQRRSRWSTTYWEQLKSAATESVVAVECVLRDGEIPIAVDTGFRIDEVAYKNDPDKGSITFTNQRFIFLGPRSSLSLERSEILRINFVAGSMPGGLGSWKILMMIVEYSGRSASERFWLDKPIYIAGALHRADWGIEVPSEENYIKLMM